MDRFRDIYEQNVNEVYRFLLSLCRDESLAEDLTQETFLKALSAIDSFRGECKMSVWLCQIAKNLFYKQYHKSKNTLPVEPDHIDPIVQDPGPESDVLLRQETGNILKHLHTLNDPYKEVFMLHIFGEVPLKEISALFGKSDSWARVTFYRAKAEIIEKLKEETQP